MQPIKNVVLSYLYFRLTVDPLADLKILITSCRTSFCRSSAAGMKEEVVEYVKDGTIGKMPFPMMEELNQREKTENINEVFGLIEFFQYCLNTKFMYSILDEYGKKI